MPQRHLPLVELANLGSRQSARSRITLDDAVDARAFHDLVLRFAGNAQLTLLMKRLQLPVLRVQIRVMLDERYRNESRNEHRAVLEAIIGHDPDAAEAAMRAHLRNAAHRIFEQPSTALG